MSTPDRVTIKKLPTGVPGLDEIVGGGLPEYSFNIIAGAPGSGKTTLAHQFVFANATPERPALYFTVLGESSIKMLRYQQQYTFFDPAKLSGSIRFINLSQVVLEKDLGGVLKEITDEVEKANPAVVVVDSFRTMVRKPQSDMELQSFIQRLALFLASWQATTFLIGEYAEDEVRDNPIFTVADGLFWLRQTPERNSIVRKLQIIKLRGQDSVPGLHTFRITDAGVQAFSRTFGLTGHVKDPPSHRRLCFGIPELDKMLGGGVREGVSVLVAGSSGTGKSVLATQFIAEGIRQGEPGIVAVFEERPQAYAERASSLGLDLETPRKDGKLKILYLRPLDLSVDETMHSFTEFPFSTYSISFLTDDIIRLRYVSIDGQLRKIMVVIKMRGGNHAKDIREYEITSKGVVILGKRLTNYQGLISGIPVHSDRPAQGEEPFHDPEIKNQA